MGVVSGKLLDLGISEGNGQLDGVWHVEVDRACVRGCSLFEASYHFLSFVSIVDVRCNDLFICVVGFWYV